MSPLDLINKQVIFKHLKFLSPVVFGYFDRDCFTSFAMTVRLNLYNPGLRQPCLFTVKLDQNGFWGFFDEDDVYP